MLIRPFNFTDKDQLIDIFRLNVPKYFAPEEVHDFEQYLNDHSDPIVEKLVVTTSQFAFKFFEQFGYKTIKTEADFLGRRARLIFNGTT